MADGPSACKKVKMSELRECPYGANCYRQKCQHSKKFFHLDNAQELDGISAQISVNDDNCLPPVKTVNDDNCLPPVKTETQSDRQNLSDEESDGIHAKTQANGKKDEQPSTTGGQCSRKDSDECSNPGTLPSDSKTATGSETDLDSSDETDLDSSDEMDSDSSDEDKTDQRSQQIFHSLNILTAKLKKMEDSLKRIRFEKHLEEVKQLAEEKTNKSLQRQLNNGFIMMEGEEEALKKTTATYFTLLPEQTYKEGSASQIHFQLAESQFYRLITSFLRKSIHIVKIQYVVSPLLVQRFRAYQEQLKKTRGKLCSYHVLAFHGTNEQNNEPICEGGFKIPGTEGFRHMADTDYYYEGGVYFCENPTYSMQYICGASRVMLCNVLPGKVYNCSTIIMDEPLQKGYDSHMSSSEKELVIFDSAAILPFYIIHFANSITTLTYNSVYPTVNSMPALYANAVKMPSSRIFKGKKIRLSGKLASTQAVIRTLVEKHGGQIGTAASYDIMAVRDGISMPKNKKTVDALSKNIFIVKESYLYQCICQNKLLPTVEFEVEP